jgi:Rieske Fe-S protein
MNQPILVCLPIQAIGRRGNTLLRKFLLLLTVAAVLAAMMVPIVLAIVQSDSVAFAAEKKEKKDKDKKGKKDKDKKGKEETTVVTEGTQPYIPKSGGPSLGSGGLLLPSVAMLLAIGVLGFAVLRNNRQPRE